MLQSHQMGGWADQLIVSAANFMLLLMVARWASVAEVGLYAIAFSLLVFASTLQDSLVTRPYTIQAVKPEGDPREQAAGALAFAASLAAGLSGLAGLTAGILWFIGGDGPALRLAAALAAALPFLMLREFARRYSFAHLRTWGALATDVTATMLAAGGIIVIARLGMLTAATAIVVLAWACGIAAAAWVFWHRAAFAFRLAGMRAAIVRSARLGKWLFSGQLAMQAQAYAAHWITLAIGGAAVTGLYAACLSIVALSNPFLFGYFNLLTPKFARTLRDSGNAALCRQAALGALFLAIVIGGFAVFVTVFGAWLLGQMFPAEDYREASGVLSLLAFAAFAGALGGPASVALMAAERGKPIAITSAVVCIGGSALVLVLMSGWGLMAAAFGILATETAGSIARWLLLLRLLPRERHSAMTASNATAIF
jgi:O-antigen/teichoic acid export membrane protein